MYIKNIKIYYLAIISIILIGCEFNKDAIENTIFTGTAKFELWNGFDFSEGKVVYLDSQADSTQFIRDIDETDILITGKRDTIHNRTFYTFILTGSPVTEYIERSNGTGYWDISCDESMFAIDTLLYAELEDVKNITNIEFKRVFDFYNIYSMSKYVYAIKTQDSLYALFKIMNVDTVSEIINISLKWKYQSNGTRYF